MKLVRHAAAGWTFQLTKIEAQYLRHLVGEMYPFGRVPRIMISKKERNRQAVERESLLHESLAEHREHLKQSAAKFLAEQKWAAAGKDHLLTLNAESREMLFQILNDVRVGCWRALGEPESLDLLPLPDANSPAEETRCRYALELAGYFEYVLLEPEE
jgi:hypothetical protein